MAGLLQDLRYGVRSLLKTPGFTAVAVLTLAIGIGANTAMFGVIHAALLAPLPYPEPDRLVLGSTTFDGHINPWTSKRDWYDFRDQADAFEHLAATRSSGTQAVITGGERPERVLFTYVSDDLFATMGVPPIAGRWFLHDEGQTAAPYVALVSEGFARRRFGSPTAAIGRALIVGGIGPTDVSPTIVGVMPASFRLMDDVDVWMPMRRGEDDGPRTRQFHNWWLVGRLKPGVSLGQAQHQVNAIAERLRREYPDSDRGLGLRLDRLQAGLVLNQTPSLLMLMAAVVLVLLIACANVAGLLLARGAVRRSEMAVRAALGASRTRLVRQLLTESVLLASVAGLAGIVLAFWLQRLLPIVTGLAGAGIAPGGLGGPVLAFALAASMATALLFGLAPAARASSVEPSGGLASGARTTEPRSGLRLRGVLVVGQIALSLALLVGAGLLIKSFARLTSTDLGFDAHDVLTADVQLLADKYPDAQSQSRFFDGLRQDLDALPGVTATGITDHLPIRHPYGNMPVWPEGKPPADPAQQRTADFRRVLPGHFDALGMHLLAGRDISSSDAGDAPNVAVVNERMARELFPDANAIGQQIVVDGAKPELMTFEIVGVVNDARIDTVNAPARLTMYAPLYKFRRTTNYVAIRTVLPPVGLAEVVRRTVAARDPDVIVANVAPLEQLIGASLLPQRVTAITLVIFSAVALLLASLGLYGMVAYDVAQHTHEIGVRMALGANRSDMFAYILRRSGRLVGIGLLLGGLLSLGATRAIGRLLYQVTPTDASTFVLTVAFLSAAALVASVLPAWRAARVDPARALRAE